MYLLMHPRSNCQKGEKPILEAVRSVWLFVFEWLDTHHLADIQNWSLWELGLSKLTWRLVVVLLFDCLLGKDISSEEVVLQCCQSHTIAFGESVLKPSDQDIIKETKQKAHVAEDLRERWNRVFLCVLVECWGKDSFSMHNMTHWNNLGSFPWWNFPLQVQAKRWNNHRWCGL